MTDSLCASANPIADGGPAFAALSTSPMGDVHHQPGMSLRDWFAGKFAVVAAKDGLRNYDHVCPETARRTAETAYALADAMLAERAKAAKP